MKNSYVELVCQICNKKFLNMRDNNTHIKFCTECKNRGFVKKVHKKSKSFSTTKIYDGLLHGVFSHELAQFGFKNKRAFDLAVSYRRKQGYQIKKMYFYTLKPQQIEKNQKFQHSNLYHDLINGGVSINSHSKYKIKNKHSMYSILNSRRRQGFQIIGEYFYFLNR